MSANNQVSAMLSPYFMLDLERDCRIAKLEELVMKKPKHVSLTAAQKFLILFHLGALEPIRQNRNLTQKSKANILQDTFGINAENAEKYLVELSKKVQPLLQTRSNYEFLVEYFERLNEHEIVSEVDRILLKLNSH